MRLPDGWDAAAAAGLGALGYGLYLVSLPAALVVCGAILLAIGVAGAMRRGRRG